MASGKKGTGDKSTSKKGAGEGGATEGGARGKSASKKTAEKSRREPDVSPPQMIDRRAIERTTAHLSRLMGEQEFETIEDANRFVQQFVGVRDFPSPARELTPLEQAQDIMYEAWGARGKRRAELAREALKVSPDCADAYVMLAEETTRSVAKARELFEQGVRAGERALGAERFAEDAGMFWGQLDTRPYMRAREGLAECLLEEGKTPEAIEHLSEMLRLNPNDNQGVRYTLALALLEADEDEKLAELLARYGEDAAALWLYTRALAAFRREGASAEADKLLREAFDANPFVTMFVLMPESLPEELPDYVGLGDPSEAASYVMQSMNGWLDTPGALDWFAYRAMAMVRGKMPRTRARRAKK